MNKKFVIRGILVLCTLLMYTKLTSTKGDQQTGGIKQEDIIKGAQAGVYGPKTTGSELLPPPPPSYKEAVPPPAYQEPPPAYEEPAYAKPPTDETHAQPAYAPPPSQEAEALLVSEETPREKGAAKPVAVSREDATRMVLTLMGQLRRGAFGDAEKANLARIPAEAINKTKDKDDNNNSLLHIAVKKSKDALKALTQKPGIDPNVKNKDGQTPLHLAAEAEDIEAGTILIRMENIDIDQLDEAFQAPIHIACDNGDVEFVRLLLNNDADSTIARGSEEEGDGYIPLHIAVGKGFDELSRTLSEKMSLDDLAIKTRKGGNIFHVAAKNVSADSYTIITNLIALFQAKDGGRALLTRMLSEQSQELGQTPLHFAAKGREADPANPDIVKAFMDAGAPLAVTNEKGNTPFGVALYIFKTKFKKIKGPNPNREKQLAVVNLLAKAPAQQEEVRAALK